MTLNASAGTMSEGDTYTVSVLLLCVTCREPIKAWISSPNWIRVEWISPSGECQACWNKAKEEKRHGNQLN